jgi:hypothetical protein
MTLGGKHASAKMSISATVSGVVALRHPHPQYRQQQPVFGEANMNAAPTSTSRRRAAG